MKPLADDWTRACGVIGKPGLDLAVRRALPDLEAWLRQRRAPGPPPVGLPLSLRLRTLWGGDLADAG